MRRYGMSNMSELNKSTLQKDLNQAIVVVEKISHEYKF